MGDYTDSTVLQQQFLLDDKDYYSKFLFNPNISGFPHIDHNMAVTRLSRRYKEPEQLRAIMKALHVLNKPEYFKEVMVTIDKYDEKTGEVEKVNVIKKISIFPKTYHHKLAAYHSIVMTCAAAEGHLIREANTKGIRKEESVEDKTSNDKGFFNKKEKDNKAYRGY